MPRRRSKGDSLSEESLVRIIRRELRLEAEAYFRHWVTEARAASRERRDVLSRFERGLERKWGRPLALFETALVVSIELGSAFNERHRPAAAVDDDQVFDVLVRLHATGCRIASEVLALLRSGHASGAHGRWRSLHELAAVSLFVRKHGFELAERFRAHEIVACSKAAHQYNEYARRLKMRPPPRSELERLKHARDRLLVRFGASFREQYGWASDVLKNPRPTFADIERDVGLDHWRPYYQMASHPIHAGMRGLTWNLETPLGNMLAAGPSDAGLADPGHAALISLNHLNAALLVGQGQEVQEHGEESLVDQAYAVIAVQALTKLVDLAGSDFLRAHRKIERRIRKKRSSRKVGSRRGRR